MILPDVNVLVHAHRRDMPEHDRCRRVLDNVASEGGAHRRDMPEHDRCRRWLERVVNAGRPYGMSEIVLSAFVRIVTNRRVFRIPSTPSEALSFTRQLLSSPDCVPVRPGPAHWAVFERLCRQPGVTGNLVADAYLAAIAMEADAELVTMDGDFARFPGCVGATRCNRERSATSEPAGSWWRR